MAGLSKVRWKLHALRWRKQNLDPRLTINLKRAGKYLQKRIREEIQIKYPPASKPGHPPHRRSGRLWKSIVYRVGPSRSGKSIVAQIGSTNVPYALRLEYGFVGTDSLGLNINQAARPFLRSTVTKHSKKVAYIIGGGSA